MTPPLPSGPFDLVLVDLPLRWVKGKGRSPQRHYRSTIDIAALRRLPVADIMAKDAAACFWVYEPPLPDTLKVIEAWKLTYKTALLAWTKITAAGQPRMGTGKTTRKTTENMRLATRGHGLGAWCVEPRAEQELTTPREATIRARQLRRDFACGEEHFELG
jgi:N6-adenosine-specific RNA methylase IME4